MSTTEPCRQRRFSWLIFFGFFLVTVLILTLTPGALNLHVWSGLRLKAPEWAPLLAAPWIVQVHLATVMAALVLGPVQFALPKGTRTHKIVGRTWAAAMLITAVVTLFIRDMRGGFSPIHLFSVMTLLGVPMAVWLARTGRIGAHTRAMIGLYIGLLIAGVTAVAPGRLVWEMFFR